MTERINELLKDIEELRGLEKLATRNKSKDILSVEIHKLTSKLCELQQELAVQSQPVISEAAANTSTKKKYEVKLSQYSWSQTETSVTFYVDIKNVHLSPKENIKCEFNAKSLELKVVDLDDKDYVFKINNLLEPIKPEESTWIVKTDKVRITAVKQRPNNWSHVTQIEKKTDPKAVNSLDSMDDEDMDPNQKIMSLMKRMYETGDDDMKRTIGKAWSESLQKSSPF